jgi:hypothetical protein
MDAVVHAGSVCFQNESGARDGGWLKEKKQQSKDRRMAPEGDLTIAFENGKTNFVACGVGLKTFAYLEMALFLSSVTRFGRIGI